MGEPKITLEQVCHVADLARLALPESELETMRSQLASILDYMAELDAIDVEGVEPSYHAVALAAPLRPDVVQPSLPREESLAAAPQTAAGGFAVPRVMRGEGEE